MDVLKRRGGLATIPHRQPSRWSQRRAVGLALCALAALAACFAFGSAPRPPSFPHNLHVHGLGLECTLCHVGARTADQPGIPPPELCKPCHDNVDPRKPAERRVTAFFGEGGRFLRQAPPTVGAEVRFSHQRHGAAGLQCADCHQGVAESDHVEPRAGDWMATCVACHETRKADTSCRTCHQYIDKTWQPQSHDRSWRVVHGEVYRRGDGGTSNRCSLCHDATTSCQACHQTTPPHDHNNQFRERGHGLLASLDRSRCMTCHKSDSCTQCHGETRPVSHRGGFGLPSNRHCTACHFPLADNGCNVCHKTTAAHDTATPMPSWHNPNMSCRTCHGNGVRLPHPDGGHLCIQCHH